MTDLRGDRQAWLEARHNAGLERPILVFRESVDDHPKPAAWVSIDEPDVLGHVILWDTGECEIDVGSTTDASLVMVRSAYVRSANELRELLNEVAAFAKALIA